MNSTASLSITPDSGASAPFAIDTHDRVSRSPGEKPEAAFLQRQRGLRDSRTGVQEKPETASVGHTGFWDQINARLEQAEAALQLERAVHRQEIVHLERQKKASIAFSHLEAAHRMMHVQALHRKADRASEVAREKLLHADVLQRQEIARLAELAQVQSALARDAQIQLTRLRTDLDSMNAKLEHANQRYQAAIRQVTELTQQLTQENDARQAADGKVKTMQASLEEANLKYRWAITEEIPALKTKLKGQYSTTRALQHESEQIRIELKQNKRALADALNKGQRLQRQKAAADQQVCKTRDSLSFQLGYLLIHSVKSVRGLLDLPAGLWAWRTEAQRRRKKNEQHTAAALPSASSASLATPAIASTAPVIVQARPLPQEIATHQQKQQQKKQQQKNLCQLKMACIMDEFTYGSYSPECKTQQLTPENWRQELEAFRPELLFVESAWRGKDALWGNKVGHASAEVQGIVAWCREKKVPTVFWNKEDPVHFGTFLNTAQLFDHVFTTDIDCIHRYKAALRHEQVYLLPFACQPASSNPIEAYQRKDAFCFAGAYYARYPERTRDLGNFVAELPSFRPLEIYDRNFGKDDPNHQFPPEYQSHIVGTLPFDQIDKAYKGYRYAINLNSIKQSQTMFARRLFELLASNTVTVSNFSRGARLLFGDLVITTDSGGEMLRQLNKVASDDQHARKLRLAALRKVMQEHTYGQRLAYVASKVTPQLRQAELPEIAVLAHAANQEELALIIGHARRQRYTRHMLYVVLAKGWAVHSVAHHDNALLVSHAQARGRTIRDLTGETGLVAGFVAADYYGPNYLLDIALATLYSKAGVIGKAAHYALKPFDDVPELTDGDAAYRPATHLRARCAAFRFGQIADADATVWLDSLPGLHVTTENGLGIDEFNYCRDGAGSAHAAAVTAWVDDLPGIATGIGMDQLLARAERIAPELQADAGYWTISGKRLATDFGKSSSTAVRTSIENNSWRVESTLEEGKHEYLHATLDHAPDELGLADRIRFYLDTSPGLNIQLVLFFLDAHGQKINHTIKHANSNQEAEIPAGTARIRFGLRVYGSGSAEVTSLVLGHRSLEPADLIGQAQQLVLTNHYPSYDDLYRNGFVHSRVRAYAGRGVRCDVFRLRPKEQVSYHEFEGVDVTTGSQEALHKLLASGQYRNVLVHFLDPAMWEVLQHHVDRVNITVWVHGAEIQPWHRRDFNFQSEDERNAAKIKSAQRMAFWRGLLQSAPANLKLVFVSRYFAEEVMEDLGFRLAPERYAIIHNPIDTDLFSYREKAPEQRKKVLSIRPYASAKYANDLSVKAIQLLSAEPWFDDMEFRLIGDGPLMEDTLAPLRKFRNVYIEQRFLKQSEIAALHQEYGIFLCPTRMDAQGVSRDEAMASGLVPVTNAVAAVPEFVDETCGLLAPHEDYQGLAEGIVRLYEQPDLFMSLSSKASRRVREQSGADRMIDLEMNLFNGKK